MDLIRDLLDKKVVDRNGREMGRVDGVVLHIGEGTMPHVIAIELGPAVLAYRVWPIFGRWIAALEQAAGGKARSLRIALGQVLEIDDRVKVDLAFGETAAAAVEQRLRRWLTRIPWSS